MLLRYLQAEATTIERCSGAIQSNSTNNYGGQHARLERSKKEVVEFDKVWARSEKLNQ